MVRVLFAALTLLLCACGDGHSRGAFTDSQTPPGLATRFYPPEGWAWGLVTAGGFPPQRYGVASPPAVPRAQVLIVPGLGESAEGWFETARDLVARGATVWILDRAGQGGSGRFSGPRDIIHTPSFGPDIAGVQAMGEVVIRPGSGPPFFILASGDGAVPALLAVAAGTRVDGLILSAPRLADSASTPVRDVAMVRMGLGGLPAPGRRAWSREGPDGVALGLTHDPWRGRVADAWRLANPDLRVSGTSLAWQAGYAAASRKADRELASINAPVLLLGVDPPADGKLCGKPPRCVRRAFPGSGSSPHLEADKLRAPWLGAAAEMIFAD